MLDTVADDTYKYLNFNEIESYVEVAKEIMTEDKN
jgi:aconitase B